jgi:hypothetical protein
MHDENESLKLAYDALGVMLEAASRDQESISQAAASISNLASRLQKERRELPSAIVNEVRNQLESVVNAAANGLTERIRDTNLEAATATAALKQATRYASARFIAATALVVLFVCAAIVGAMLYVVHDLVEEKGALEHNIAALQSKGAELDLIPCMDGKREAVCVRVNPGPTIPRQGYEQYRIAILKK